MSKELTNLLKDIKELIALWHWLSNLVAFLTLISEKGITEGSLLWIISSVISGIIAELVGTFIPSYLRPIFKYLFSWD